MTIEEVREKKLEMEQKISAALKEFEEAVGLEVGSVGFSRCAKSTDLGINEDYSYNVETKLRL